MTKRKQTQSGLFTYITIKSHAGFKTKYMLLFTVFISTISCIYDSANVIRKCLIWVEDPFGIQHGLKVRHEAYGFLRLTVVDVVSLLQPEAVFGADASLPLARPLVHIRLDRRQKCCISGGRRDVQMKIAVT